MSSNHDEEDQVDFVALGNDDSSSGKIHPTPIKHVPVDFVCRFHHNLPDLENINPTFLGPENELTHCPCVVVFGGTETFGAFTQTNSMYVLECGNIASRNQVVSLCNQEQIDYYVDGNLISNQKGNDKYDESSSTSSRSEFLFQWKEIEYGSSEQIPSAREFPCFSYERHSQKCYLFGGYGGHYFNDVWEFNLRNKTWTRLVTQGNVPSARCGCSGMANRFGLVVFGGFNGTYLDDFYFLDFKSKTWIKIDSRSMNDSPRTLTVLTNNSFISDCSFFIFGGYSGTQYKNDFFAFDFNYNNDARHLGKWKYSLRNLTPTNSSFKANSLMLRGLSSIYGTHMAPGHHSLLISGYMNNTSVLYELEEKTKTLYVYDIPSTAQEFDTEIDSSLVFELDERTVGVLSKHCLLVLGVRSFKLDFPFLCFRRLYKPEAYSDVRFEWK